jgi:hypothetical protein
MRESRYQSELIEHLEEMFPGCIVIRLDPRYVDFYMDGEKFNQGVMDLLVLFGGRWAALEVKPRANARRQPNQSYFIEGFDRQSYAAFICPENEEEVLDDLQRTLGRKRHARVP